MYFNRTDVQAAINAPVGTSWYRCTPRNVFGRGNDDDFSVGDESEPPATNGVLERVVDGVKNIYIGVGGLDFLLPVNGTLLVLQNVTWAGRRGFQRRPDGEELFVPYHLEEERGAFAGAGVLGRWGRERGVTFYEVALAGHEVSANAPGAMYRVVEAMLGRIANLSERVPFTTRDGPVQPGQASSKEEETTDGEDGQNASPSPAKAGFGATGGLFEVFLR